MNNRGWGWNSSEVRQAQLAEYIAEQSADTFVHVMGFYDVLPDQDQNTWDVAHDDLKGLERRGLISLTVALGGIPGLHVRVKQGVRDLAEELRHTRANKRLRKVACRDAMVSWLYSLDATSKTEMPARDTMLADPRHGMWLAEPFTDDDLDTAAAWLHRNGLADGLTVDQCEGPVRLYLTDAGVTCAEDFDSDTSRYMEAQQQMSSPGPTVNIGTNSGPFQVAGDNARQQQNIGTSPEQLRLLISGIAEIVRALVPDAADVDEEEAAALVAITDSAVDRRILQRFCDWVVSTVRTGGNAAAVAAVSSTTTLLLEQAGHVASHLA